MAGYPWKVCTWTLASLYFFTEFTCAYSGKDLNAHFRIPVWLTGVQIISSYLSISVTGFMKVQLRRIWGLRVSKCKNCILAVDFKAGVEVMQVSYCRLSSYDCRVPFSLSECCQRIISAAFNLTNVLGDCSIIFSHMKIKIIVHFPWGIMCYSYHILQF